MSASRDAILAGRFLHPGESSEDDLWVRVAKTWGSDLQHTSDLYNALSNKRLMLNTPALANAGRENQMGSACFVLPISDSLTDGPSSIMGTLKDAASVHKAGGGTGFSFGRVRGRGTPVTSTGRPAPGAVNVLRLYSSAVGLITQAGMRSGANMGILPIDHPDIEEFLLSKQTEGNITNFNLSVAMTDEFMDSVRSGHLDAHSQYLWDLIVKGAWQNGEPGLFFIDTTNNTSLHPEPIEATNPCGEVPLRPYEACVLGSINLAEHILLGGDAIDMDWAGIRRSVFTLVEALDNVIERQSYPIPEIEHEQKWYRKIGVGVMGFADLCCILGHRYGDYDSVELAREVMSCVSEASYEASDELRKHRAPYAGWWGHYNLPMRRNLCCNVIAPTGTISRLAECSFGIEPHFDVDDNGNYQSFIMGGEFTDHQKFYSSPYFTPASQVSLEEHLEIQAAFQEYTDQAVSKTINCPHETTLHQIEQAYIAAWEMGCKGITVLREGSREDVVIGKAMEGDCVGGVCPV